MIICGRLDLFFENLLIVVSSRLKENINCGWVIRCWALLVWITNHDKQLA